MTVKSEFGSCRINEKGYLRINSGPQKDKYLHRAVFEKVAGRPVKQGLHIHHMNGKLCWCPHELLELPMELHPSPVYKDPYTGEFMTRKQFFTRYG